MADPWAVVSQKPAAPTADPWKVVKSSPAAIAKPAGMSDEDWMLDPNNPQSVISRAVRSVAGRSHPKDLPVSTGSSVLDSLERIENYGNTVASGIPFVGDFASTLWKALTNPGPEGARAGEELAKGALGAAGAFVGGELGPEIAVGRSLVRTPSPARLERAGRLADFQAAGVRPNFAATAGNRGAARVAKMGEVVPIAGGPIRKATAATLGDTAATAERLATAHGGQETAEDTAGIVHAGLQRFIKDKSAAKANYAEVDRLMHGAPATTLPATRAVSEDIRHRFADLDDLNAFFNTPVAQKVLGSLKPEKIPAKVSPIVDAAGRPIVTQPAATKLKEAHWNDIKELRSEIGRRLFNLGQSANTETRRQLARLYGSLTNDMFAVARAKGPAAYDALRKANSEYAARMKVIDRIAPLVRPDNPDRSFADINRAAQVNPMTGGSRNRPLLESVKKALTPDEWRNIGAAAIRRLGHPAPGTRLPHNIPFSAQSFVTNWNKLSATAKDLLFGPDKPGTTRSALETLARVSGYQAEVGRYENVSRSGEMVVTGAVLDRVLTDISHGGVAGIAKSAATLGTGYTVAKILMSPRFARWASRLPRMMRDGASPQLVGQSLARAITGVRGAEPQKPRVGDRGPAGGEITGIGAGAL